MKTPEHLVDITTFGNLYEAVQLSGIFPDSKYFVDAIPLSAVPVILADYEQQKQASDFSLKHFVEKHFQLPKEAHANYQSANKPLVEHLHQLWKTLQRSPSEAGGTLISLPNNYIVPGGRFREIYYWDSYFTMLGLAVSNELSIIENMVQNFASLIDQFGHIPNGNRSYYLSRSQPPFFGLMVQLLASLKGREVLFKFRSALEKEYQFWMDGVEQLTAIQITHRRVVRMSDGSILNRYWDDRPEARPEAYMEDVHLAATTGRNHETVYRHIRAAAESGWDFSSRWFEDPMFMHTIQTTDIVPVDLNCLLFQMEQLLLEVYESDGNKDACTDMAFKVQRRKKAIQVYCWDEVKGFYHDLHINTQQCTPNATLAGMFPLFMGIAAQQQADKAAKIIEQLFLQPGGVVTTPIQTGQQWDAPNGWAPLQWITYKALQRYQHNGLANQIRERWMHLNEKTYAQTGKMMEKYNVCDTSLLAGGGEYPNQDGFGWTNGVYLVMYQEAVNN